MATSKDIMDECWSCKKRKTPTQLRLVGRHGWICWHCYVDAWNKAKDLASFLYEAE